MKLDLKDLRRKCEAAHTETKDYYHDLKVLDVESIDDFAMEFNPQTALALLDKVEAYEEALEKLIGSWLIWPLAKQPDPRITQYESRTIREIQTMAKEALKRFSEEK